jgi:excisionase family DNA binding protein
MPSESKTTADKPCRIGRISDLPVSKSTAERLIKDKLIDSYMQGRLRLIDLDSFERWAKGAKEAKKVKAKAPKAPKSVSSVLPNFTRWVKGEPPLESLP